jgi:hypothetical protein
MSMQTSDNQSYVCFVEASSQSSFQMAEDAQHLCQRCRCCLILGRACRGRSSCLRSCLSRHICSCPCFGSTRICCSQPLSQLLRFCLRCRQAAHRSMNHVAHWTGESEENNTMFLTMLSCKQLRASLR